MRPGICGIVSFDQTRPDTNSFNRLQNGLSGNQKNRILSEDWYSLAQAGYESTGYEDNCLLHSADRTICFEGRIDNRRELSKALRINEDDANYSIILSKAYSFWGPKFYEKILGAFTVCIVLTKEGKIILANDHMGLRPMYLSDINNHQLAFGSDVSQLLAMNNAVPSLNKNKVLEMLSPLYVDDEGWSNPESTLLEGFTIMPNGTSLEINREGKSLSTQYWKPPNKLRRDWSTPQDCADEFREIYLDVIKDQIDTKYPIGADLSGGIDSGCNVAVIAYLLCETDNVNRGFHTFTATFGSGSPTEKEKVDAVLDEWEFIQQNYIQGDELCGYLESGEYRNLRTTANCVRMNIPESYVAICQLASRLGCKSIMTGEGADWYLEGTDVIWDSLIKSGNVTEFVRSAKVLKRRASWKVLSKYLYMNALKPMLPGSFGRKKYVEEYYESTLNAEVPDIFTTSFTKKLKDFIKDQGNDLLKQDQLSCWNQQLEHELVFPPNHGWQGIGVDTELLLPYLDKRLLEFGLSVPPEYKFTYGDDRISHYGSRKCLQRNGLGDIVPDKVINSQYKEGYSTPVDNRLFQSLPSVFTDTKSAMITEMNITDSNKLQRAIQYVLSDKCNDPSDPFIAWLDTLLGLELWLRATKEDFGLK